MGEVVFLKKNAENFIFITLQLILTVTYSYRGYILRDVHSYSTIDLKKNIALRV